ncbi:MAG: hypothetical protein R2778_12915 [Saprospiraceae bacterium]
MAVFTTAYPKYAIQGFDLNALDYLLKPISLERFMKAVNKALEQAELAQQENAGAPTAFVDGLDFFIVR